MIIHVNTDDWAGVTLGDETSTNYVIYPLVATSLIQGLKYGTPDALTKHLSMTLE